MRHRVPSAGTESPSFRTVYDAPVRHEVDHVYAAVLGKTDTTPERTLPFAVELSRQLRFDGDEFKEWDYWTARLEYGGPGNCFDLKISQQFKSRNNLPEKERVSPFVFESLEEAQFLAELILALVEKMRRTADAHRIPLIYGDNDDAPAPAVEQQVC